MDLDLGMLLVRLALGPVLFCHGWNKVLGGGGLAGTTRWFDSLGLRPARLHARVAAANELTAGALLTLGLLTPLACAAFVGLMAVAAGTDHRGKGFFVFKGGWEYVLVMAVVAVGVAAAGPGAWSLDSALGLDGLHGPAFAGGSAALGIGGAVTLLVLCYRPPSTSGDAS